MRKIISLIILSSILFSPLLAKKEYKYFVSFQFNKLYGKDNGFGQTIVNMAGKIKNESDIALLNEILVGRLTEDSGEILLCKQYKQKPQFSVVIVNFILLDK